MARQHSSFLLRCWTSDGRVERIETEHIQSGEKTIARTMAEVAAWVIAHSGVVAVDQGEAKRKEAGAEEEHNDPASTR